MRDVWAIGCADVDACHRRDDSGRCHAVGDVDINVARLVAKASRVGCKAAASAHGKHATPATYAKGPAMNQPERLQAKSNSRVHIHAPATTAKTLGVLQCCPDCKKRTRVLSFHVPWYGWDSTCLRCGRRWCDGEWMPLDFVRGSRRKSIDAAKRRWRALPPVSENHFGVDS